MSGWVAGAGLAGSAIAGLTSLKAGADQQGANQNALQMAILNYQLNKRALEQQYELSTAGRQDARGNRTHYIPGYGWVTDTTPETEGVIRASDAGQRQSAVDFLTRRGERDLALDRRLAEGSTANPMLDAIRYGYGAPNRGGVLGANKISGVTGVSENADAAKSGYATTALRSGVNTNPRDFSNINKGATTGVRSALANVDANAEPLFQQHMSSFMSGKLNPYNTLATRAANVENVPFSPEGISGNLDAGMANAAAAGATTVNKGLDNLTRSAVPVMQGISNASVGPNYGQFLGGLTEQLQNLLRSNSRKSGGNGWDMSMLSGTGGTY